MIHYHKHHFEDADIKAARDILKSSTLIRGRMTLGFEEKMCEITGAPYALAVSSGTAALHMAALLAMYHAQVNHPAVDGQRPKALLMSNTFVATANALAHAGFDVTFVDQNVEDFNMDLDSTLKHLETGEYAVCVVVHYGGFVTDMHAIYSEATKHSTYVIEDAAYGLGSFYSNSMVGECKYSDAVCFSFQATKLITTGEGGMVCVKFEDDYNFLHKIRNNGITKNIDILQMEPDPTCLPDKYYEAQEIGLNYHMTEFQAALGCSQLARVHKLLEGLTAVTEVYDTILQELFDAGLLYRPKSTFDCVPSNSLYMVQFHDHVTRREVVDYLDSNSIQVNVHYKPVHTQPAYYNPLISLPNTENIYRTVISLPIYPSMEVAEAVKVATTLLKGVKKKLGLL